MTGDTTHKPERMQALDTYVKLVRATDAVTTAIHRHLGEHGLTISQFGVLEALLHKGAMCQRDIAKKILKSTGNITTVIDNLEKRGLVMRTRSDEDRRYFAVTLTEKGARLIGDVFPVHVEEAERRMAVLSREEQAELARLCKKLGTGS